VGAGGEPAGKAVTLAAFGIESSQIRARPDLQEDEALLSKQCDWREVRVPVIDGVYPPGRN
jgi:hypothetical protein